MLRFTATVYKFGQQGEKTGWTYISLPAHLAQELMPGNKKSFRVKGTLDGYSFKGAALLPMGGGDFIMAINATMRNAIRKGEGATIEIALEIDLEGTVMPPDFAAWLEEDEAAKKYFYSLPKSHQNYWIKWLDGVKTKEARLNRLTRAVAALANGFGFAQMLRAEKASRS